MESTSKFTAIVLHVTYEEDVIYHISLNSTAILILFEPHPITKANVQHSSIYC